MTQHDDKPTTAPDTEARTSGEFLAMGLGIGAFGVLGAIAGSAVCPVCIVATPALLGVGLYKRWRERRAVASAPVATAAEMTTTERAPGAEGVAASAPSVPDPAR